ncbi:immunoglobulin tau heavy chain secretory form [Anopheles sinensis]|uniref:Immunoglobulin tau heavy chain secretory form n=1 Tax=Anopheles sinensis TaxID=74873 RepID=A0A084WFE9_ANOSI|nr:immunoglobulin tau heavy chain secretory form [Anopheles sinensis]
MGRAKPNRCCLLARIRYNWIRMAKEIWENTERCSVKSVPKKAIAGVLERSVDFVVALIQAKAGTAQYFIAG